MSKIRDFFHYLFVPSEKNNLRAKVLHNDFLSFYLVLALVLVFSFKTFKSQLTNVLGFATDITVQRLYELTNEERSRNGLSALAYNNELAVAAQLKAQNMFAEGYWAHFSPTGRSPWEFILASGYKYEFAGENLAKNFLFSQDVVNAWMASPTHRENIVRGDFRDVGFAVVNGVLNGEETTLVVQMFGSQSQRGFAPAAQAAGTENVANNSPSLTPSPTPTPTSAPILGNVEKSTVLISGTKNLPKVTSSFSYLLFGFIILALVIDLYFAYKMDIFRVTSKNLAHIIFLLFILAGFIFYITKGSII